MKFTKDHEWVDQDGDTVRVGITPYAANALGDIVFVELPEIGAHFNKGDDACVVESVKAASDVYAPLSGEVTQVNTDLEDNPSQVNEDATGIGWFFALKLDDDSAGQYEEMMDEAGYQAYLETLG